MTSLVPGSAPDPGAAPDRAAKTDVAATAGASPVARGSATAVRVTLAPGAPQDLEPIVVDEASPAILDRHDLVHATLRGGAPGGADGGGPAEAPTPAFEAAATPALPAPADPAVAVLLFPSLRRETARSPGGPLALEVVVDGWRFEVLVEDEARASLRERAGRGRGTQGASRRAEVRAMIPGRVVSVGVAVGQPVEQGSPVLVIEAMKMQNEIRAPRDGTVTRVAVEAGHNVDAGDLLVVIE